MSVYYNENDPYAAQWLRNLIALDHLPAGDVDESDIQDVMAIDLYGYDHCHFFAGIGGWPLALRIAGWPDDEPVWAGSCPCQPFSAAGKQEAERDSRHLWPVWKTHIAECKPSVIFGEQVASALGREWLAGVRIDLEEMGYVVGAADLCAASAGAPHIRQRLFWVAYSRCQRIKSNRYEMAGTSSETSKEIWQQRFWPNAGNGGTAGGLVNPQSKQVGISGRPRQLRSTNFWSASEFVPCADKKARRIEPGSFPLAHGISARVGRLRGYGNAIVPWLAAEFIKAAMES